MSNKKKMYLIKFFLLYVFFFVTTFIYITSLHLGQGGVAIGAFGGGDDGYFYWEQIQRVYSNQPWNYTSIYPYVVGSIMKLIPFKDVFVVRMINYMVFVLYVNYSLKINKILSNDQDASGVRLENNSKIYFLLLNLMYLSMYIQTSISIYRDIWIYFLYSLSLFFVLDNKNNKIKKWLSLSISLYLLFGFRRYALISFMISHILYFLFKNKYFTRHKRTAVLFLTFFLILYFKYFMEFSLWGLSLQKALEFRYNSVINYSGGSNMHIVFNQNNPLLFIGQFTKSFIGNFIGPLPSMINSFSMLIAFMLESIPMMIIICIIYKYRKTLSSNQKYLLVHAFIWICIIAFTNDNIGTATRLRPIAWINIFNVFSIILAERFRKGEKYD